jgi:hypothetical protein
MLAKVARLVVIAGTLLMVTIAGTAGVRPF